MGLLDLVSNTVEGVAQTAIGAAKLVVSPVTQLADPSFFEGEDSHVDKALDQVNEGIDKIGKAD